MKVRLVFPVVTILLAIALSACGIGVNAAKPTPTPDPQKAMLAFAQCMRDHGVNLPDPGSGGGPVNITADPTTMDAAQNACKSLLKGQDMKQPSAAEQAKMRDALLKFSACMRAHGINMPDPTFSGNGATVRAGDPGSDPSFDPNSAEFKAAQKVCQKLLPDQGKGMVTSGSGGAGSGGSGFSVQGGGK
jgi:hypothetical protein